MPSGTNIEVLGRDHLKALIADSNYKLGGWVEVALLDIAEKIADDVRGRYEPYSAKGAMNVQSVLRASGSLRVQQKLRKTRDMGLRRTNFGPLMMRKAFLPALDKGTKEAEDSALALLSEIEMKWAL